METQPARGGFPNQKLGTIDTFGSAPSVGWPPADENREGSSQPKLTLSGENRSAASPVMSNPFDNLDLTSLYVGTGVQPKKAEEPSVPIESLPPASIMAQPPEAAEPKPVMNAAPLLHHQQSLRQLGGVGMQAPPSAAAPQAGMMPMRGSMQAMGGSMQAMSGSMQPMGGSMQPMGGSMQPMGGSMRTSLSGSVQQPMSAPPPHPPAEAPPAPPQQAPQGMWGPAPTAPDGYGAPAAPAPAVPAPDPAAAPEAAPTSNDPFGVGAPPPPQAAADPNAGAVVPAAPAPAFDPLDIFGAQPAAAAAPSALVPSAAPADDPFGLGVPPATPAPAAGTPAAVLGGAAVDAGAAVAAAPSDDADFWAGMGFGAPSAAPPAPAVAPPEQEAPAFAKAAEPTEAVKDKEDEDDGQPVQLDEHGLPVGGEYYECRINTPKLGAMFFHAPELKDSLFLETPKKIVDALADRPVVAFTADGSAAEAAGVGLGHILLKVNSADVEDPSGASKLIKESPRPLKLQFYDPKINVVLQEGMHMVKYDTKDFGAPPSSMDWKPKYVVIGGIVAKPWMMNMYYNKADYDSAVIDIQSGLPISVKVKQFNLQGARIWRDEQTPPSIRYPNKPVVWRYFVIIPRTGYPIKISAKSIEELKPVHMGVRRELDAQEMHRQKHRSRDAVSPHYAGEHGHGYSGGGGHHYSHEHDSHGDGY